MQEELIDDGSINQKSKNNEQDQSIKSDIVGKEEKKQESFIERNLASYFCVPTRPLWLGGLIWISYTLIREDAGSEIERTLVYLLFNLCIFLSGVLVVYTKEYPMWGRMATIGEATLFGWLIVVIGSWQLLSTFCQFMALI